MYLVFSTSLHPDSRSRILARSAVGELEKRKVASDFIDLADLNLPHCDGNDCYELPEVVHLATRIRQAQGILISAPVYNYDLSSSAKNLIELTGNAWSEKVVGFLCSAGGQGSYMSPMGLASSLMLDFRCLILPQFVYVTDEAFKGDEIDDPEINRRIAKLVERLIQISAVA